MTKIKTTFLQHSLRKSAKGKNDVLDLSESNLSNLPEEIGLLEELRTLYLGSNFIAVIPRSIGRLKNLVFISLSNNRI